MNNIDANKVKFVDKDGKEIEGIKEAIKQPVLEVPEGCIEDPYSKGTILDLSKDHDKIINAINALGFLVRGLYAGAVAMANGREQKLEKKLGMKLPEVVTHATTLISDIRLIAYGNRDGVNPYADIWEDYKAIANGTYDHEARQVEKLKKTNDEFVETLKVDINDNKA